ncbi:MAG TPA: ThiF family adenylyltransferase [Prolixibacteraceae bacterium]
MIYSVAIKQSFNEELIKHLIRKDGQEDLCFALYEVGTGNERITGLITDIILPDKEDRNLHGNVSFNSCFFDKVIHVALKENKGIVFIHSHPSVGWQSMSQDDIDTEKMLAPRVRAVTNKSLIGMTLGTDGSWSARFWNKSKPKHYKIHWCVSVRVVGKKFSITHNDSLVPPLRFNERFVRTISAWGEKKQANISRLKVGIVGVGSVGSQIAESLLRTGVQNIVLIDFDIVKSKNLDRLHSIVAKNVGFLKTDTYAGILNDYKLYSNQNVISVPFSIVEEYGLNSALDCDIIFCCVDRPWPRFVLNCIAYAYLIPVIDGGIDASFSKKSNNLEQARWRTYTANPERRCMKCMEQYTPENVSLEQSGLLEDQNYIKGLPDDHFSKRGENVYAFSLGLAGLQMQQFLSLVLTPKGVYYGPKEMDFTTGNIDADFKFDCDTKCEFHSLIAIGDNIKEIVIHTHEIAEKTRKNALYYQQKLSFTMGIKKFFKGLISRSKV